MTIGTNLRHLREERGLTQEQVADKMDVTFQAVSAWERDEYKPDIHLIVWQLSPDGRVQGINGEVDINVFNGYQTQFNEFIEKETIQ